MTAHVADCVAGYDVDGEGDTFDDALEAIASQCERTADECERSARTLRAAAKRYRAMRQDEKGSSNETDQ